MKKLSLFAVMSLLMPVIVGAQVRPVPPAATACAGTCAGPRSGTCATGTGTVGLIPSLGDAFAIDTQLLQERAREMSENALRQTEQVRMSQDQIRALADRVRAEAERVRPMIWAGDLEFGQRFGPGFGQGLEFERQRARRLRPRTERPVAAPVRTGDRAVRPGDRAEGHAHGRRALLEGVRAVQARPLDRRHGHAGELQKSFKDSKYVSDAKALEAEVRKIRRPARTSRE